MPNEPTQTEPTQTTPPEPPKEDKTDWKAEAKKWEGYARANLEKAKAYDAQQQAAQKAADEAKTLEQKVADLTGQFNAAQAENVRMKVAAEKGVPAELLQGQTEDQMREFADKLAAFRQSGVPATAPVIPNDGNVPNINVKQSAEDQFFTLFNNL